MLDWLVLGAFMLALVGMAMAMDHSGMTFVLARGLSEVAGPLYALVSPFIGLLGAFMTGSNTNSNVVFTSLQMSTAELLGYSVPGFPFLASIIAIFSGVQLFALGIIGEYLARMHFRLQDRPPYVIGEQTAASEPSPLQEPELTPQPDRTQ